MMRCIGCFLFACGWCWGQADGARYDYRVLATNKTSTMEKEMNEAGDSGYEFMGVMGGETAMGGKEVVVVMGRKEPNSAKSVKRYKLLATSRTSTMQKELQQAGNEGFEYKGQTVFESTFGGKEVSVILESDTSAKGRRWEYRLPAASRTSTMQKELREAGEQGYALLGLTVGKSSFGGAELICLMRRAPK